VADEKVRYSLIVWETLRVLRDAPAPMERSEVIAAVQERIQPTPYEREQLRSGGTRWETPLLQGTPEGRLNPPR
jgi:hypothetical protein